jgi:plastocyanin
VFKGPAQLITLALAGLALTARAEVVIEGTVTLPPPKKPAAMPRYQITGEIGPAPAAAAIVFLEGKFPAPVVKPPALTMGQRGYQFEKAVLPVRVGTRVEFPNFDPDYHNVFSYSKSKRFDLGRYRKGETPAALVFDQPGVIRLYCDIHEHMRSVIVVLDTPHFTTTDAAGKFRLNGLPAGHYVLKAWIDEKTTRERPVELKAGETLRVDFPAK